MIPLICVTSKTDIIYVISYMSNRYVYICWPFDTIYHTEVCVFCADTVRCIDSSKMIHQTIIFTAFSPAKNCNLTGRVYIISANETAPYRLWVITWLLQHICTPLSQGRINIDRNALSNMFEKNADVQHIMHPFTCIKISLLWFFQGSNKNIPELAQTIVGTEHVTNGGIVYRYISSSLCFSELAKGRKLQCC